MWDMNTHPLLDANLARHIAVCPTGCWVWGGSFMKNRYGTITYGRLTVNGKTVLAHRHIYEMFVGPVRPELTLDHKCRVRLCVNPDHLEPVTMKENILRGFGPPAINARKTTCNAGHPFKYYSTIRERRCLVCQSAAVQRYKKRVASR